MNTTDEVRDRTSPESRGSLGALRLFAVGVTSIAGGIWELIGHKMQDARTRETRRAPNFSGIGFYARPHPGAKTDAFAGFVGGSQNPVIVATRDEATRARVANIAPDETAMFNTLAIAVCRNGGTFEVKAPGGTPQRTMLGETYRNAEDQMLTALSAAVALISNIPGLTAPQIAIVTAATAAISVFQAASASYLTQVLRAQ